jgi:hypothetical protein
MLSLLEFHYFIQQKNQEGRSLFVQELCSELFLDEKEIMSMIRSLIDLHMLDYCSMRKTIQLTPSGRFANIDELVTVGSMAFI